jgi:hypothetical protein
MRCVYCFDSDGEFIFCQTCCASLHPDCYREHGVCASCGHSPYKPEVPPWERMHVMDAIVEAIWVISLILIVLIVMFA